MTTKEAPPGGRTPQSDSRRRRGDRKPAMGKPLETVGLQSCGAVARGINARAMLAGLRFANHGKPWGAKLIGG